MRLGRGGPCGEDVIFIDLHKGLFAVADGAERAGGASQRLMAGFGCMAETFTGMDWEVAHRSGDIPGMVEQFRKTTESLLADIPYGDAATFTALQVLPCDKGTVGVLCHCGDSLLFRFDPPNWFRQISRTNFWMAGRSKKVYQAEAFPAPAGSVFLLATDGIWDLRFSGSSGMEACLIPLIHETPVEEIPGSLLMRYDISDQPVDDVALIAVKPQGLRPSIEQIVIDRHGVDRRVLKI